jgi:riboflavin synthase
VFTGIVEEVGTLVVREDHADSAVLRIRAQRVLDGVALGDSIAVNGVCLTVTGVEPDGGSAGVWSTDVMAETLERSSLGDAVSGDAVNLERAVTPHTRLGGHLMQGHVDGVGRILGRTAGEHWEVVRIALPPALAPWFEVSLIPTTLRETTLGARAPGAAVNLEVDVIAKYVERLLGGAR